MWPKGTAWILILSFVGFQATVGGYALADGPIVGENPQVIEAAPESTVSETAVEQAGIVEETMEGQINPISEEMVLNSFSNKPCACQV